MGWYRSGKLALDGFRSLASTVAPQNQNFQRGSRMYHAGYFGSCSNGANFTGFSSFSSFSRRLGTRGGGVSRVMHNPFLAEGKRFYYVDPYNVQHFRPRGLRIWFQNPRQVSIVEVVGSRILITLYFGNLETVPYTKRTHWILLSKAMERKLGETQSEKTKASYKGKILPPIHPESVRVTMIAKDITDALQRGLEKEQVWSDVGYASEHVMGSEGHDGRDIVSALARDDGKVEGGYEILDDRWVRRSRKKDQKSGSQPATTHLNGFELGGACGQ